MTVNNQYFTSEQIKAGQMQKLLDFLMSEAYDDGEYYNDIHIRPEDCGAFIVEWVQIPWSRDFGGHFEYISEEQIIMLEKLFPDNHYELCYDEDDYKERLEEWLKDNPGWVRTSYGTWTNEIENAKFQEELRKEKETVKEHHFENGIPQGD